MQLRGRLTRCMQLHAHDAHRRISGPNSRLVGDNAVGAKGASFANRALLREPGVHGRELFRLECARPDTTVLLRANPTALLEQPDVLEERGQSHIERRGELGDRSGAFAEPREDSAAGGVDEGVEDSGEVSGMIFHVAR